MNEIITLLKSTMLHFVCALTIVFLLSGLVWADMAPPSGYKTVYKTVQIETDKDFPDYVFYLVRPSPFQVNIIEISKDHPETFSGKGQTGSGRIAKLYAVPRQSKEMFDQKNGQGDFEKALLGNKIPGVLIWKDQIDFRSDIPTSDSRSTAIERYKLEDVSSEKGLVLTKVSTTSSDMPTTPNAPTTNDAPKSQIVTWVVIAALVSLAIIGLGVRFFRKSKS